MTLRARIYRWLDLRLKLEPVRATLLDEPIPGGASWIYVFGSVALFVFVLQLVSGMFLAVYYVPTPDHAYDSVEFLMHEIAFGGFIRGLHHWGASVMMVAIGLHMLQVYLYGAYKRPREVLWMVGVVLLLLTLTFGFSGYLLPWDQKAYWATQVGINMVGTVPLVGDFLARVMRGGDTLGALTLSRFFALHVLFLPLGLLGFIALHLFILRRVGPAGPTDEVQARRVSEPFYPRQVFMDAVVIGAVFALLAMLAAWLPAELADPANPADAAFKPLPEWYFLWYYQALKYLPGGLEAVATWILPLVLVAILFGVPFLDRRLERRVVRRPTAIALGVLFLAVVFGLMGVSLREIYAVPKAAPGVAHGKDLYARLQCGGCHLLHGEGAAVGPELSYVGRSRDRDWLLRHFRDPQSVTPGSIMPKYPLSEQELGDLTEFMLAQK